MEDTYKVTITALTEEAIKNNGTIVYETETDGLILITNAGEDATNTGFLGIISAYNYGRSVAKALMTKDMLDRFKKGMEDEEMGDNDLVDMLSMFAQALKEEEKSDG